MVFPLSEGTYTVDISKTFVPFDPVRDQLSDRPASLLVDIVPFLIQTKEDLIVIDPGLGFESRDGDFQIHENIRHHGFSPDDISIVLLSHLHKDHTGGICYGKNNAFNLMFPKATYYCQQQELEFAFSKKDSPSFVFEKLQFLQHTPNLKLLNGNGNIGSAIEFEVCGGHTPFHQVFKVTADERIYFFGGDVVPQPSQILRRFIAKYDYDGKKSAELRRQYASTGAIEKWIFLFFHDGKKSLARVVEENGRFKIVGVN